ncbi:MAG: xanthine dehydrogenase family protein subunit M [Thaumarchaeota archaeon]|jgi:carbon-monoxide dehydrogenase medium subunit|nr:xanthine dehydrogenase family protein subunit M [Candidatus Geocrenenecus arthurdayi]
MSFGAPYLTLPEFTYHKPKSLKEALQLLNEFRDEAKVMAGGVGLIAFMKERLMTPNHVIDIKDIPELRSIEYKKGEGLKIGATVTMSELEKNDIVREKYVALYQAVKVAADPIIRNRATLAGNICEALPWVDGPVPLIAFNAELEIMSINNVRRMPISEFIKGPVEISLEPNEMVTSIRLPDLPPEAKSLFMKFNTGSEFALATVAAYVLDSKKPRDIRLVYGAVSTKPVRAYEAEKIILSSRNISEAIVLAAEKASKEIDIVSDVLASEDYRRHLVKLLTINVLREIFEVS